MKLNTQSGFASALEVVISSVFFVTAGLAIMTSLSMLRPEANSSLNRLEASYAARDFVGELRSSVSAQSWNDSSGDYTPNVVHQRTFGSYQLNYILTDTGSGNARFLEMNIVVPE